MSKKLTRESKIKLLENFYSVDYALFGKPISEVDTCCPIFIEEYLSIKGALLSVVIEMYKLIGFAPTHLSEKVNEDKLKSLAIDSAVYSRKVARKLVESKKGREIVKRKVMEALQEGKGLDPSTVAQEQIMRKSYSLALDTILVGSALNESSNYRNLDSWSGKILEDAYKILRDQLVESSVTILENESEQGI